MYRLLQNGADFKAAGKMLMKKKRLNFFCTPSAAHCTNLMMEEIGRKKKVDSVIKACRGNNKWGLTITSH